MNVSLLIIPCVGSLGWAQLGRLISVPGGDGWAPSRLGVSAGMAGRAGVSLRGVSSSLGSCSKLIHAVAEEFPATRENKPRYSSTFPVSACVLFPNALLATASHQAEPESLLAGPTSGCRAISAVVYVTELRVLPEMKTGVVASCLCRSPPDGRPGWAQSVD